MNTNIKIIVASVSLAASVSAWSAMGGLHVRSHLGEPFSGSITVTGDEAQALMSGGRVSVSGGGIRSSVSKNGNGSVTIRLHSSAPVHEPVLSFTVRAGSQTREYTAMLDPARHSPKVKRKPEPQNESKSEAKSESKPQKNTTSKADLDVKVPIKQDFIQRDKANANKANNKTEKPRSNEKAQKKTPSEQPVQHSAESAKVKKPTKTAVTPRRHRAHAGEKLADIAARYRPRNMSQQTAMRALMMANPRAFRHGTTVRRSATLYIPTESQWHVYAQRAQQLNQTTPRRPAAQAHQSAAVAPNVAPSKPAKPQLAPPPAVEETSPPVASPPPAQAAKPSAQAAPPAVPAVTTPPEASQPVATPPKAEQPPVTPPAASATPPDVASATNNNVAASVANDGASMASASEEMVSEPVVVAPPPPVVAPTTPTAMASAPDEEGEEDSNIWLIAGAVGGVALLGGGALAGIMYLRNRRKEAVNDYADDEYEEGSDGITWENEDDESSDTAARAKEDLKRSREMIQSHTAASGLATDSSDDVYVTEEEPFEAENPATQSLSSLNDFDLNGFELDRNQLSNSHEMQNDLSATTNSADEDWSWLEGAGNNNQTTAATTSVDDEFVLGDAWSLDTEDEASNPTAQSNDNDEFVVEEDLGFVAMSEPVGASDDELDLDALTDSAFDELGLGNELPTTAPTKNNNADSLAAAFEQFDGFNLNDNTSAPQSDDDLDALAASALSELEEFDLPDNIAVGAPASAPKADDFSSFSDADLAGFEALDFSTETPAPTTPPASNYDDINAITAAAFAKLDALDDAAAANKNPAPEDDLDALTAAAFAELDLPSEAAPTTPVSDNGLSLAGFEQFDGLEDFAAPTTTPTQPTDDLDALAASALTELGDFGLEEENHNDFSMPEPSAQATQQASGLDDLDFSVLDSSPSAPASNDFDLSDNQFMPAPAADNTFQTSTESANNTEATSHNADDDLLAFDLSDFDLPETPAPRGVRVQEEAFADFSSLDLDGAQVLDMSAENNTPAAETPPSFDQELSATGDDWLADGGLAMSDDFIAADESPSTAIEELSALESFDADWNDDILPSQMGAGFVSEAVGLEEPQEAKLDLAKMYLEIEDLDGARTTLGELVVEASGEVKAEAERLLAELG